MAPAEADQRVLPSQRGVLGCAGAAMGLSFSAVSLQYTGLECEILGE